MSEVINVNEFSYAILSDYLVKFVFLIFFCE